MGSVFFGSPCTQVHFHVQVCTCTNDVRYYCTTDVHLVMCTCSNDAPVLVQSCATDIVARQTERAAIAGYRLDCAAYAISYQLSY